MPQQGPKISPSSQVCIVEASAGSGKTYCLAQRYLSLLIAPELSDKDIPLKNILAVTFSNKAALEMKERILEFLKKLALDRFGSEEEKEDILALLRTDGERAGRKAYRILDEIFRNYNFFQVQTIDSFVNAILSGCAFKLDLSAAFKIKTDYSGYLAYSLDELMDRAGAEKKIHALLRRFLAQYLFLENKTGWFPKKDILGLVVSMFNDTNRFSGEFQRTPLEVKDIILAKKRIFEAMGELRKQLPEGTHAGFAKAFLSFMERATRHFDIGDVSAYFRRAELPVAGKAKVPGRARALWKKIRNGLAQLAEAESGFIFNAYIEIFDLVLDGFQQISHKEDILFLEELNRRARRLFDEKAVTVPELYYRLATTLRHFLIDEFQDTSRLQWENIFPMIQEALASGGTLFYVGDKKQAVYRFRGGEVSLFDGVKELYRDFRPEIRPLVKNYRSRKEIVEFVNSVFNQDNLRSFLGEQFSEDQIQEIVGVFKDSRQAPLPRNSGGYVSVEPVDAKNKEERNTAVKDRVLAILGDLKARGFAYKDIAFLTRQNDEVELLTAWLLEHEIPVESEKTLNIKNNACIKEIVSFLRFLDSPIDNLSFASFVLGEIFSKASETDTDVFHDFIFRVRKRSHKEKNIYLYKEFRSAFEPLWESLVDGFFKNVGFVPLYELTVSIMQKFAVFKNFPEYQGFFMRFLELLKEKEEDKPSLASFLEYFETAPQEDLYVPVAQTDAVRVLTVHKAKGLGFPVVVIPFFEMNVKVDPDAISPEDGRIFKRRIAEKYRTFSGRLEALYAQEYKRAFIDELNTLYVGLTRPREELYCLVSRYAQRSENLAALLVSGQPAQRGAKVSCEGDKARGEPPRIELPVSQYRDWLEVLKDEFQEESLLRARRKVLGGEILHAVLSGIGDLTGQDEKKCLKEAVRKARARFPFVRDWSGFEASAARLIGDKKFRLFFFPQGASVFQEKEVVDRSGNTRRMDRLIVKEDEALIVDYKSSGESEAGYENQVKEYMRLVRDIYPKKKVRGFLVFLDDFSLKELHG